MESDRTTDHCFTLLEPERWNSPIGVPSVVGRQQSRANAVRLDINTGQWARNQISFQLGNKLSEALLRSGYMDNTTTARRAQAVVIL